MRDCALQCSVPPSEIVRDMRTISHRVESEGVSFLTITLPSFDSVLLQALANGRLPSTGFPGFRNTRGLPSFLRGFLRKVFNASGNLLDEPCVTSVACLHQICLTFKKVKAQCSDARVTKAMQDFVRIDRSLPGNNASGFLGAYCSGGVREDGIKPPSVTDLSRAFRILFSKALLPLDRKIFEGERIEARHGPGATAEKVMYNDKFRWTQWTERLGAVFASDAYLHAMEHAAGEGALPVSFPLEAVTPELETPVRVIQVPKTMKGPRIIAIEPVVMQYMQQGLLDGITKGIKGSFIGASVLFDDQSINATRALRGSKDGHNATLDLSEASDRVSFWLVDSLVRPWFPNFMDALDATRSRRARVPCADPEGGSSQYGMLQQIGSQDELPDVGVCDRSSNDNSSDRGTNRRRVDRSAREGIRLLGRPGRIPLPSTLIELRKFASMGSAVCFPVEAMVFTTIVFCGVADSRGLSLTPRLARSLAKDVSVFGDDIIVPVDSAPTVVAYLEAFGLKVNYRKSFWTGRFRESCGTDAFQGEVITPSYLKTLDWDDSSTLSWLASWVEFSNSLYFAGYWETARTIRKRISRLGYRIPMVSTTSPAIGYHNVRGTYEWTGWHRDYHQPMVLAYRHRTKRVDSPLDDIAALRKVMTTSFNQDNDHLTSSAMRSSSVGTKKRWTSPY